MYFDGDQHILIIIRQIRRTQPIIVRVTTTLIDANVLVCIVLPVQLQTPGRCGCVWGDLNLLYFWLNLSFFLWLYFLHSFLKYWMIKNILPGQSLGFFVLQATLNKIDHNFWYSKIAQQFIDLFFINLPRV